LTRLSRAGSIGALESLRRHHLVLAGVIDAGVSSAATFAVGLVATHFLDPDELGAYALAFSVFVLSGFIPAQLVFTPTEIAAVDYPRGHQLPLLRASLSRGALVSLVAAVATSAWVLIAPPDMPRDALPPLAITCAAATFVSPIQDHLRRMLHIAEASWRSVVVAVVQMVFAIAGIVALSLADVPATWVPFGVLVIANVASLSVGLLLTVRDLLAPGSDIPITRARLLRSGQPLLLVGLLPSATAFAVSWLVSALAGAATLGYVEAARIVSQPVSVLQVGLGSVLGPRVTRAASSRDEATATRVKRQFERLILIAGVGWALAVAAPAPWNLLTRFLPTAYVVPGLVAASIAAFTIMSLSQGRRYELFGAARERLVARAELEGNVVRIVVALFVGVIGAFAVPLGIAALGVVRWVRPTRWLAAYYAEPPAATLAPAGDVD
jgi:O-antigen/teichoic acid export membrane protein